MLLLLLLIWSFLYTLTDLYPPVKLCLFINTSLYFYVFIFLLQLECFPQRGSSKSVMDKDRCRGMSQDLELASSVNLTVCVWWWAGSLVWTNIVPPLLYKARSLLCIFAVNYFMYFFVVCLWVCVCSGGAEGNCMAFINLCVLSCFYFLKLDCVCMWSTLSDISWKSAIQKKNIWFISDLNKVVFEWI